MKKTKILVFALAAILSLTLLLSACDSDLIQGIVNSDDPQSESSGSSGGDRNDSITSEGPSYPFKESIISYVFSGNTYEFVGAVTRIMENYPKESLDSCMTLVGSHDTTRILTVLSGVPTPHKKADRADSILNEEAYKVAKIRLKVASVLQYVLPGVPCLYYGDEAGAYGYEDPLNRGTYPWGREDLDLIKHYQKLGELRAKYKDLLRGETHFENLSNEGFDLVRQGASGQMRLSVAHKRTTLYVNGQVVLEL